MSTTNDTKSEISIQRIKNPSTEDASCSSNANLTVSRSFAKKNLDIQRVSDDTLTRMAIEEICRETAKGAIRAEKVGPSGWLPCPLRKTNKRFLRNTINSVICYNKNKSATPKKSEKELDEIIRGGQRRKPKLGDRKHCFRRPDMGGIKETSESKVKD